MKQDACLLRFLLAVMAVGAMAKDLLGTRGNGSIYAYRNSTNSRTVVGAGETYSYVFSPSSSRNFNSGARYYLQNMSQFKSTTDFGYSYSSLGQYYRSAYGYRLMLSPNVYWPDNVGHSLYYYPPMFQYYHFFQSRYWEEKKPRYVCRNDYAFWPLENQTSEFLFNRKPALNLTAFDVTLPAPLFTAYPVSKTAYRNESEMAYLTELDSLAINTNGPKPYFSGQLKLLVPSQAPPGDVPRTKQSLASIWNKHTLLAYNYFVCPDGKDPDEIYCCGPVNSEYCCLYETYKALYVTVYSPYTASPFGIDSSTILDSFPLKILIAVGMFIVGGIIVLYRIIKRRRMALLNRNLHVPAAPTGTTMVYVPTATGGNAIYAPGQPPSGVATAYPAYQPVPNAPPNYASVQYPPPSPRVVPSYPTPGAAAAVTSASSTSPVAQAASVPDAASALNRPTTPKLTEPTSVLTSPAYSWTPTSYTSTDPTSSMSTGLAGYSSTGPTSTSYTSAGFDYTPTSLTVSSSTGPASYTSTDPTSSTPASGYTSTDPTSTLSDLSASTLTYPMDSALGTDSTPYTSLIGSSPYTSLTGSSPFSSSTAAASSLTGTTNFSSLTGSTPYTSLTGSSPYTSMLGSNAYTSLTGSTPYSSLTASSPYTSSTGAGFSSLTGTTFNPSSTGGYSLTDTSPKSDEPTS